MLAVRSGSSTLFSVRVDATLEGPTPWHAHGKGSFEIGFIFTITISVAFRRDDRRSADDHVAARPGDAEAHRGAVESRQLARHPAARIGAARQSARVLRLDSQTLVLHPFGTLEVSQKVVPLNLAISRFGTQAVEHGTHFRIAGVTLGTDTPTPPPVRERIRAGPVLRDERCRETVAQVVRELRRGSAGRRRRRAAADYPCLSMSSTR